MWTKSYSKKITNADLNKVWNVWIDVNNWNTWLDDIDHASLENEMQLGSIIKFKPKGGPNLNLEVTEFTPLSKFTDLTRFPLAKMYDAHELISTPDGIEIRSTVSIEGPLSFIWRKIVAEDIYKSFPKQTDALINRVNNV